MSYDLIESILDKIGVETEINNDGVVTFEYDDEYNCTMKSIDNDKISFRINSRAIISEDIDDLMEFFADQTGELTNDRETAINDLEAELRRGLRGCMD